MSVSGTGSHRPTFPAYHFTSFLIMMACLVAGSLSLSPAEATAATDQVIHEGEFNPRDMRWEADAQGATYPVLDGTRPLAEPGLPQLPVRDLVLLVPLDTEVGNLWIEPLETHREPTKSDLALGPPHFTDSGEMITTTRLTRQGEAFPSSWGEFTGSHVWRGYRLATVSVYPCAGNPDRPGRGTGVPRPFRRAI